MLTVANIGINWQSSVQTARGRAGNPGLPLNHYSRTMLSDLYARNAFRVSTISFASRTSEP